MQKFMLKTRCVATTDYDLFVRVKPVAVWRRCAGSSMKFRRYISMGVTITTFQISTVYLKKNPAMPDWSYILLWAFGSLGFAWIFWFADKIDKTEASQSRRQSPPKWLPSGIVARNAVRLGLAYLAFFLVDLFSSQRDASQIFLYYAICYLAGVALISFAETRGWYRRADDPGAGG